MNKDFWNDVVSQWINVVTQDLLNSNSLLVNRVVEITSKQSGVTNIVDAILGDDDEEDEDDEY